MTRLRFRIEFHGPFLVSTGRAGEGYDATTDRDLPLPATSLKGLMRAEAGERLGLPDALVASIFGAPRRPSSWAWTDADFATVVHERPTSRIRVDEAGRTVAGFLAMTRVVWSESATFEVAALRDLDPSEERTHSIVLRAAARSVSALGSSRRRGQGWVAIRDLDADTDRVTPWTVADTRRLQEVAAR